LPKQVAEWEALRDFHDTFRCSADLPSPLMTRLTRLSAAEGGGDEPPCNIRAQPGWDELWAPLLGRFPRPERALGSEQRAPPQPTPATAVGGQTSTSRLPTQDELVVRNGRITGTNHTITELNQSQRRVDIIDSIADMPHTRPLCNVASST
jgi:hypothetical protein